MQITTTEASRDYGLSITHIRYLLGKGLLTGRQAQLTASRKIWLINEESIEAYLKTDRRPGRKQKTKT